MTQPYYTSCTFNTLVLKVMASILLRGTAVPRKVTQGFCGHYKNKTYLANKATEADKKLKTLAYCGDRKIFNIE